MKQKRLTLLLATLLIGMGMYAQELREVRTSKVKTVSSLRSVVNTAAAKAGKRVPAKAGEEPKYGVKASMKYEQLPDMAGERKNHQIFPSGSGFVVIGGHDGTLMPTRSAELYQNGKWSAVQPASTADNPTFSVLLGDGRVMVGGGNPMGAGTGQSKGTAIYNPATLTFTKGPDMTVERTECNGILVNGNVYVAGNWFVNDNVFDRYNGSTFSAYGTAGGFMSPYLFADQNGNLIEVAPKTTEGNAVELRTYKDTPYFPGLFYDVAEGQAYYYTFPFVDNKLLDLPTEMRTSDYCLPSMNFYFLLSKSNGGEYILFLFVPDAAADEYDFYEITGEDFTIPTRNPANNATIEWRGGVFVNEAKYEAYLIGTSGTGSTRSLHLISYDMLEGNWSFATVDGLGLDPNTAAWTMLSDGRLACTGGNGTNLQPVKAAYIFTPPTAGTEGTDETPPSVGGPRLVVWLKSGEKVSYELADQPITMFSGNQLIIRTNKVTVSYDRKNVLRYTYENVVTKGIELSPGERRVQMSRDGDMIVLRGLKARCTASVYSVNGMLLEQHQATEGQPLTISLQNRPRGMYIVKAATETIKIMKQ